jgi:hypothetical protein
MLEHFLFESPIGLVLVLIVAYALWRSQRNSKLQLNTTKKNLLGRMVHPYKAEVRADRASFQFGGFEYMAWFSEPSHTPNGTALDLPGFFVLTVLLPEGASVPTLSLVRGKSLESISWRAQAEKLWELGFDEMDLNPRQLQIQKTGAAPTEEQGAKLVQDFPKAIRLVAEILALLQVQNHPGKKEAAKATPAKQSFLHAWLGNETLPPVMLLILGCLFFFIWNTHADSGPRRFETTSNIFLLAWPYFLAAVIANQVTWYSSRNREEAPTYAFLLNLVLVAAGIIYLCVGP